MQTTYKNIIALNCRFINTLTTSPSTVVFAPFVNVKYLLCNLNVEHLMFYAAECRFIQTLNTLPRTNLFATFVQYLLAS